MAEMKVIEDTRRLPESAIGETNSDSGANNLIRNDLEIPSTKSRSTSCGRRRIYSRSRMMKTETSAGIFCGELEILGGRLGPTTAIGSVASTNKEVNGSTFSDKTLSFMTGAVINAVCG